VKMEAVHSSETSVNFYQTTPCHISEANTLHDHHHKNLKNRSWCPSATWLYISASCFMMFTTKTRSSGKN
jgi:hypothetical protein